MELADALEAWRETRDSDLADTIDRLAAQCRPSVPHASAQFHAWWVEQAQRPYDPAIVAGLVEGIAIRLRATDVAWSTVQRRWPGSAVIDAIGDHPGSSSVNWIERLAAIMTWPDDPQVAPVLASWLTSPWRYVAATKAPRIRQIIGDRLIALRDRRVVPRLRATLAESFDTMTGVVATMLGREPERTAPRVDDPLWAEVAAAPEVLAPRAVLGDALLARDDSRGTLFALQLALAADPPVHPARDLRLRRAARLIAGEWEHWLGDLALLVVRSGSAFRNGMLEVIRVGQPSTPRWLWTAVCGHRELGCVHTVRPLHVPAEPFAQFVVALPNLRTLELDSLATAEALARIGRRLPITRLEYRGPQSDAVLAAIAPVAPAIRAID